MRVRTLLFLALLAPNIVSAQTIRGVVVEYGTPTVIAGASIEVLALNGRTAVATSDSLGHFVVYPPSPGRVLVRASHPSYIAEHTDTVTTASRETVTLVLRMTRQAIPIAAIVVTARSTSVYGGFYERQRKNAFGTYIDEKTIARKPPISVAYLMRDVHGVEIGESYGSTYLTLRGHGMERCAALIFVNGMPMAGDFDLDHAVPLSELAAVEIYPDATAVPFEFTSIGNDCGAVAFWTRPVRNSRPFTFRKTGIALLLVAVLVVVETVFVRHGKSDISGKAMRDFTLLPPDATSHHMTLTGPRFQQMRS